MEQAPKNDAPRGREQGSCSRMVTARYLLVVTGLSLLVGCATAGKSGTESAHSGSDTRLRLAKFVPARYDKPEVLSEDDASLFEIERSLPPAAPVVKGEAPAADPTVAVPVEQGEDAARAAEGNEHGTSAKE